MPDLEAFSDRALRSTPARWVGLAIGLVALGFLVRTIAAETDEAVEWARSVTLPGVAAFAAGFLLYHAGALATLRPLLRDTHQSALPIWAAAQVVKYLPLPGSAVLGMVGSTVRRGGTTREGLGLIIRHSLLHVGAATLVGAPSVVAAAGRVGVPWALTAPVLLLAGGAVAWGAVRHLPRGVAVTAVALAMATWAGLGVLLAVGFDAGESWLLVAAAYPASWVVGQLAVPVPAGIGVREAMLLVLLGGVLGDVGAATFALGTRLLHLASDGGLAAVSFGRDGLHRAGVRS